MDHTQLQTRYNELWKCYCALIKEMGSSNHSKLTQTTTFDPNMHIPEVVPDSDPPSPYRNAFLGFTKPPPCKPQANLSVPIFPSSSMDRSEDNGSTTEEESDDMGSDWEMFKQGYEKRRHDAYKVQTTKPTGSGDTLESKRDRKLATFVEKMDKKYPYRMVNDEL
ncbi:hypothetical protein CVT24_002097 [Panaeolus cyanescens]|uniref:Uncharacterized protein n=1 Tax=Panaeolus cyanescens TaxID=181874 RepID=A0A409WJD8_9AGAR|nr:hypothetical protein CVT24_002097 [Panaeolus cyanescens]